MLVIYPELTYIRQATSDWIFLIKLYNCYSNFFHSNTFVSLHSQRQGCIHGEDLPYFFGAPLVGGFNHFPKNYTKAEMSLSEVVMLYWSNFVRTGWVNYTICISIPSAFIKNYICFLSTSFVASCESLRNPNEQQDNRDRGKSKNIEWTAYESVHKKYLNLGKFIIYVKWASGTWITDEISKLRSESSSVTSWHSIGVVCCIIFHLRVEISELRGKMFLRGKDDASDPLSAL